MGDVISHRAQPVKFTAQSVVYGRQLSPFGDIGQENIQLVAICSRVSKKVLQPILRSGACEFLADKLMHAVFNRDVGRYDRIIPIAIGVSVECADEIVSSKVRIG
jgi:hypothetical protein